MVGCVHCLFLFEHFDNIVGMDEQPGDSQSSEASKSTVVSHNRPRFS
jgi:hypothetical protein